MKGVVVAFCIILSLTGCSQIVFVTDSGLETAIRFSIGKSFGLLTENDLLQVTTLDANGMNIQSLKGIEYCTNLRWADFSDNKISDLTPLVSLGLPTRASAIEYLNLSDNAIVEISSLAGLLNLRWLSISGNAVWDISPLVDNATNPERTTSGFVLSLDVDTLSSTSATSDLQALAAAGVTIDEADAKSGNLN